MTAKSKDMSETKAPTQLKVEEINMLYQLAKQASIPVSNIAQVYQTIQHTEQYLIENLKK